MLASLIETPLCRVLVDSMASATWCLYFVQDEPGETAEEPNATQISKPPGTATLADLVAALAPAFAGAGAYHYRVRVEDSAAGFAWLDITDPNERLPMTEGCVFCKVSPHCATTLTARRAQRCERAPPSRTDDQEGPRPRCFGRFCGWTAPPARPRG
jgi:hypothetical protein